MSAKIRTGLALLVATGLTLVIGLAGICGLSVIAWTLRMVCLIRWARWISMIVPRVWSFSLYWICVRGLMGVECYIVKNETAPLSKGHARLLVGNHPTMMGFVVFGYYVNCVLHEPITIVMKKEMLTHLFYAIVAWPIHLLNMTVVIDRKDPEGAKRILRDAVRKKGIEQTWVIFADQHRPTFERICADREKFVDSCPDIGSWLTETTMPRYGGTRELFDSLCELSDLVEVVDLTIAFHRPEFGFTSLTRLIGSRCTTIAEDVTVTVSLLRTTEEWIDILVELWRSKNKRIRGWRKGPSVPIHAAQDHSAAVH